MAAQDRRNTVDLISSLRGAPHRFGFFQAVRLLALADPPAGDPLGLPGQVRFRTPASLAFPASELTGARAGEARLELEVGFLGLTGPSGVLPRHYTETLMERRIHHRDGTLHAFLDIFSHRACALFFAAWRKYRFHIAFEQDQRAGFTARLADLAGFRPPAAPTQSGLPSTILAHFAGALARRPLPAWALESVIAGCFRTRARLESYHGQWTAVPPGQQTRLGDAAFHLGAGAFLGERFWDPQHTVRLHLGPLPASAFQQFLPGRPGAEALGRFLALQFGPLLACQLELELDPAEAPAARLVPDPAPRLGLDAWVRSRPGAGPARAVFRLQA